MATTIQISDEIKRRLQRMKLFARESYNEIIERMNEDEMELNEKTKREIEEASKRIKAGKGIPHEKVIEQYGL